MLAAYVVMETQDFNSSDMFVVQTFLRDLNWQISIVFWSIVIIKTSQIAFRRYQQVLLAPEKRIDLSGQIQSGTKNKSFENDQDSHI